MIDLPHWPAKRRRAASAQGMDTEQSDQWQAIDTAPKDGSRLLLWGYWNSGAYRCIVATWSGDYEGGDPYWRSATPGSVNIVHAPTHWMPLPPPPEPRP